MRRALIAMIVVAPFGCNLALAQTDGMGSPLPGIGATTPLGMTPGSSVPPVGIPMGATELASPGLSPAFTSAVGMTGTGTTCSAMGNASAENSGSSTDYDGGGMAMGTGTPLPGSAPNSGTCSTSASGSSAASSSAAMSSSSPSGVSRTGIPLDSVEIGNGGLSEMPVPTLPLPTMSPTATVAMPDSSSPISAAGSMPTITTMSPSAITNYGPGGVQPLPGSPALTGNAP
jgi:hypothetical protein